jgi:hypothetical protein
MKRFRHLLLLLAACLLPGVAVAQIPADLLLQQAPDAVSGGMAGVGLANIHNGSASIFHNVSTLGFAQEMMGVGYSYSRSSLNNALQGVSGFYKIGREGRQGVTLAYRHFRKPSFAVGDGEKFHARAWDIEAAYFRNVAKNLSMGLTLRYLQSDVLPEMGSKRTGCVDFGATYHHGMKCFDEMSSWSIGFQAANLGPKLDGWALPARLGLGGAVDLPFSMEQRLQVAVDLHYLLPSSVRHLQAGVGAEYNFLRYAIVRAGYHFDDKAKGLGNYGTVGCGINFMPLTLNFAYNLAGKESFLRSLWQLSVAVAL